jgi:pyruvate dehydrogenase E1 component alpha subunit
VGPRDDQDVGVKRKEDLVLWKRRDPIVRLERAMIRKGLISSKDLPTLQEKALNEVTCAWERAAAAPYPAPAALLDRVYSTKN